MAVFETDLTGWITYANPHGRRTFGYPAEDLARGVHFLEIFAPEEQNQAVVDLDRILQGKGGRQRRYAVRRKDGSTFPALVFASPTSEHRIGLRVVVVDLSPEILAEQENERKRVARELHDSVVAQLAAIQYGLEVRLGQPAGAAAGAPKLEEMISLIRNTIEETRRIISNLRPSILDDLGILPTVDWLCRDFQNIYSGIRLEKEISIREEEVPEALKIVFFRVLQESLNNAAQHSQANRVRITLDKRGNRIRLVVEDNGRGFEPRRKMAGGRQGRGMGLTGMRERVEFSGGEFILESAPGSGTRIEALWPRGISGS